MGMIRAFAVILGSAFVIGLAGALIGYALGKTNPNYYRSVFDGGDSPNFDPVQVGLGLGLTQGLTVGFIIGAVVVIAVTWYRSKRLHSPVKDATAQTA